MVDIQKVLTLALTGDGRQTPTVAVTTPGMATVIVPTGATRRVALKAFDELSLVRRVASGAATLVVRRRGVDYRATAVDAREFTVAVPPGSLVGLDWARGDAFMVMDVLTAEV
jgi:hypothetical protein